MDGSGNSGRLRGPRRSFFNPLFPPFDIPTIKASETVPTAVCEGKGGIIHYANPPGALNGSLDCESRCVRSRALRNQRSAIAHHRAEAKKIQCDKQECSDDVPKRCRYPSSLA